MPRGQIPRRPAMWPVIVAFAIAAGVWIINWIYGQTLPLGERGIFGDMFGAVNSLFSGLAFVGVIYAITMQRHEIAIARQDIRYTKEILDDQKAQLERRNEETKKQTFEATFFQLVRLFSDLTNQIDLQRTQNAVTIVTSGKDVFPVFLKRLKKTYRPPAKSIYGGEDFNEAYEEFYSKHNTELGHYFRTVYNIIKFIDNSDIPEKNFYSNLLRAQLSDSEAALLFHNGLSKHGIEKFKPLMERYGLLKNVNEEDMLDKSLASKYEPAAFGK